MKLTIQQRAICANILVGCASLRFALSFFNDDKSRLAKVFRLHFDTIYENLTGSSPSIRNAVNAWDKIKDAFDGGVPEKSERAGELFYALGCVDEAFDVLVSTLQVPIHPDFLVKE